MNTVVKNESVCCGPCRAALPCAHSAMAVSGVSQLLVQGNHELPGLRLWPWSRRRAPQGALSAWHLLTTVFQLVDFLVLGVLRIFLGRLSLTSLLPCLSSPPSPLQ